MGKPARKAQKRLEARQAAFDRIPSAGPSRRRNSKKVRRAPMSVFDWHRPGSQKK